MILEAVFYCCITAFHILFKSRAHNYLIFTLKIMLSMCFKNSHLTLLKTPARIKGI